MKSSKNFFAATMTTSALLASTSADAASLAVDFQATIASEQHPDYSGEARFYHVSVNPINSGIGSYAATIVGTNNPAAPFVRNFDNDVIGYKWIGGTNNSISGVSLQGGESSRISYATQDTVFDGFGQNQLKFWSTTNPGADLATGGGGQIPFNVVADENPSGGYRSFGGAVGTIDLTGLFAGSLYIFYGSFNATPSVSAILKDTDGNAPDIVISNAHLNNDSANRTEYYVAELDFITDGIYDTLEFEHLANGVDYTGNGRGLGTLLTGSDTPPPELSLQVDTVTGQMTLLGDDNGPVSINYYQITSAGNSLNKTGWNSLADQDYDGNGPANGSGNGWEEAGGSGAHALAEGYLLSDSAVPASAEISLGLGYNASIDAQDLVFRYRTDLGKYIDGIVTYVTSFDPADLDQDGDVDDADFGIAFAAFTGPGGSSSSPADLDNDGDVDDADFGIAFAAFTGPGGGVNVPEPASFVMLSLGALAMVRRRR